MANMGDERGGDVGGESAGGALTRRACTRLRGVGVTLGDGYGDERGGSGADGHGRGYAAADDGERGGGCVDDPSQMQQFVATVQNSPNASVTWSVVSGPGAISAAGWYTSPIFVAAATVVTVRATSVADPTKSGTATITVNAWAAGTPYQYFVSDNFASIDSEQVAGERNDQRRRRRG